MFENKKAEIYNGSFVKTGEAPVDLQPYEKTVSFEDNIEIPVTQRVFCAKGLGIDLESYLEIQGTLYKVLSIKAWDDYDELWLYECERDRP